MLKRLAQEWFAPSCVLCDAVSDTALSLCTPCQQDLPWIVHHCHYCGLPLENRQSRACVNCEITKPIVDHTICALHYSSPVDYLIKRMKFGKQLSHAKVLGVLLSQHLSQVDFDRVDAILPVPLHNSRLRSRGFNQSLELAREIKQKHHLPLLKGIKRVKNTAAQTLVKGDDRVANVKGAFSVSLKEPFPEHVAIIDDVVTTGATTNELAAQLKQSGVRKVSVWSIARATTHD